MGRTFLGATASVRIPRGLNGACLVRKRGAQRAVRVHNTPPPVVGGRCSRGSRRRVPAGGRGVEAAQLRVSVVKNDHLFVDTLQGIARGSLTGIDTLRREREKQSEKG